MTVKVKSLHSNPIVFGKYGRVSPGDIIEVSCFDFLGSLKEDSFWQEVKEEKKEAVVIEKKPKRFKRG